jgi:hypothetical protein
MTAAARLTVAACLAIASAAPLAAAPAAPDAATLLFEENQLAAVAIGSTLVYDYSRRTANAEALGEGFDDQVKVTLTAGHTQDSRTADVELLTGPRRLPTGSFADMTGNPVLSLFLELHVKTLSERLNANPRYLKNAIRAALRDKAEVTPAEVSVGQRNVAGWRVRVTPFRDDPNKARMRGLDGLVYEFVVAEDVPGEIAEIRVEAPAPQGPPLLTERIAYDSTTR